MKRHIRLREFKPLAVATYIPSPEYLQRRPSMDKGWGYFVDTDSSGYLKTGNHIVSKRKIVLLGDSFHESLYVSQNYRISSVLELLLNSNGYNYEILNASISGLTLLQAFNIIINKVASDPPYMLIIGDLANDIYPLAYEEKYWNKTKFYSNLTDFKNDNSLTSNSNFYNTVTKEKLLRSIIYFCNEFNIKMVFTSICNLQIEDRSFFRLNRIDNKLRDVLYRSTKEIVEQESLPYIDVSTFNEDNYLSNMQDDIHINSVGAENVALSIYNFIVKHYSLEKTGKSIRTESISNNFITAPDRSKIVCKVDCAPYFRIVVIFEIKCLSEVELDYIHVKIFGNYKNGIDIHSKVWQQRSVFFDIDKHDTSFPISFRSNSILEIRNIKLIFL